MSAPFFTCAVHDLFPAGKLCERLQLQPEHIHIDHVSAGYKRLSPLSMPQRYRHSTGKDMLMPEGECALVFRTLNAALMFRLAWEGK